MRAKNSRLIGLAKLASAMICTTVITTTSLASVSLDRPPDPDKCVGHDDATRQCCGTRSHVDNEKAILTLINTFRDNYESLWGLESDHRDVEKTKKHTQLAEENWKTAESKQSGKKTVQEEQRAPRTFTEDEAEYRLLKNLAAQLFFAVRKDARQQAAGGNPVEVEMLLDSSHNLFIAANKNSTLDAIAEMFALRGSSISLGEIVETPHESASMSEYERHRTKKSAQNLERWKSTDGTADSRTAAAIYQDLRNQSRVHKINLDHVLEYKSRTTVKPVGSASVPKGDALRTFSRQIASATSEGPSLFLIYDTKVNRHAEETLADLLMLIGDKGRKYWIYGRKRPCASCCCRLQHLKEVQGFSKLHYSEHPGRLFLTTWRSQPTKVYERTLEWLTGPEAKSAVTSTRFVNSHGEVVTPLASTDTSQSESESGEKSDSQLFDMVIESEENAPTVWEIDHIHDAFTADLSNEEDTSAPNSPEMKKPKLHKSTE